MRHSKLVTCMLKSANFRGHTMVQNDIHNIGLRTISFWMCDKCGSEAVIDTHPQPNSIDIGGEAMALNCEDSQNDTETLIINRSVQYV